MSEPIVRIAARGEGVTASGRHVPLSAPGDLLLADGEIVPGPGHRQPPCRHFPECGGCQLQHLTDAAFADYCESRVAGALAQHGINAPVRPAILSPPRSRRRASLHALNAGGRILIGFNAQRSNRVVDMRECHVLRPELFALIAPLRSLLFTLVPPKRIGEVQLTLTDQGVDLLLGGVDIVGLEAVEAITVFAERHALARLSIDEGYGAEPRFAPRPITITLGGRAVPFPVGAFLQATQEGEVALVQAVGEAVSGASRPLDLFAGLGTFAFTLPGGVAAAEASLEAVRAMQAAAGGIEVQHRDLYRRPYDPAELASYDAVVLDPPRAGAEQQVRAIAASSIRQVAYVSCNPATFARDARLLVDGGYSLRWVQPVGQFLWSTHVELAAAFSR